MLSIMLMSHFRICASSDPNDPNSRVYGIQSQSPSGVPDGPTLWTTTFWPKYDFATAFMIWQALTEMGSYDGDVRKVYDQLASMGMWNINGL